MNIIVLKGRYIFKLYQTALARRPYLVHAVQTGVMMGAGDVISQTVVEKKPLQDVDFKRVLRFSSIGFLMVGPVLHTWYGFLNKRIGSAGKVVALKKVFFDQGIGVPTFYLWLLPVIGVSQGKNFDTIKMDLGNNYFDVLKTSYIIWPWVQLTNFYYVPLQYQVLVVQTVALVWNTYLAWKTNRNPEIEKQNKSNVLRIVNVTEQTEE